MVLILNFYIPYANCTENKNVKGLSVRSLQSKKKKPVVPFIQVVIACDENSFIL